MVSAVQNFRIKRQAHPFHPYFLLVQIFSIYNNIQQNAGKLNHPTVLKMFQMIDRVVIFCFADHINGDDYRRSPHRITEQRPRSRSRSPRGYLSVRKSPELRETAGRARSVSPNQEAIQAAAREAAEQAIHLAAESSDHHHRKSPSSPMPRVTASPEKVENGPMPPTSAALQNLLASLATSGSMQMFQQPQLLAAFATLAAMANNPIPAPPPPAPPVSVPSNPFAAAAGMADGAQTLQTFANLQSLFGMPNPAAQMMSMQQVCLMIYF